MKHSLLALEATILRLPLMRTLVKLLQTVMFRIVWLWGRVRFGALVPNKGADCVCGWNSELKFPENITLGNRVVIGTEVSIGAHSPVSLGDNVRVSRGVIIETAGLDFSTKEPPYRHISKPIVIEKGAWIGARALILGGVTIGEYAVIAAGAIVTKNVQPRAVVAGNAAKPISGRTVGDT